MDPVSAKWMEQFWHVVLPLTVLFVIGGLVLHVFMKKAENGLVNFIRKLRGDGKSPHCPVCNSKMVVRVARHGINQGSKFWGCPRYPGCRGTREVV